MIFKNRNFLILWCMFLVSSFGSWFVNISGLAFLNKIHYASGFFVGMFMLIRTIPSIVFAPLIGNIVDSYDKKRLLIIVELLRFINVAVFILCAHILQMNNSYNLFFIALCIFAFIASFLFSLFNSIENSIIPEMFEDYSLQKVNSYMSTSSNISFVFAPLLSGILIENNGVMTSYYVVTFLYFISIIICLFLYQNKKENIAHSPIKKMNISYTKTALFFSNEVMNHETKLLFTYNTSKALFVGIVNASFFFVATRLFTNKEAPFSDIYTFLAVGYIFGCFICEKLKFEKNPIGFFVLFFSVNIFLSILFVESNIWAIVLISILGIGIFDGLNTIIFNTTIQKKFNKNDLGKIFSSNNALTSFARGMAMVLTAIFYQLFNFQNVVIVISIIIFIFILCQYFIVSHRKQVLSR